MDKEYNDKPTNRDEAYYENLYNDLPKEVVDILMKTHPLRGENAGLEDGSALRHPRGERRTNRKRTRPERVEDPFRMEDDEAAETVASEEEPSAREPVPEEGQHAEETPQHDELPGEDLGKAELAQMVRKKKEKAEPDERSFTRNVTQNIEKLQQTVKEARKAVSSELPEEEAKAMEELSREEALDAFFRRDEDEDDGYDERPAIRPAFVVGLVVVAALIVFLGYRTISLSAQLKKAEAGITELEDLRTANEQLKMEKLSLEDELATLQQQQAQNEPAATPDGTTPEGEQTPEGGDNQGGATGTPSTYVVEQGDTLGGIARKVYGDFSKYPLIAEANGLSDAANLRIGQELTIPAAQ